MAPPVTAATPAGLASEIGRAETGQATNVTGRCPGAAPGA
jgi:hypothetical protein